MKGLSTMDSHFSKFKTLYEFGAEQDDQAKDILKLAGWKIHRDESQKIYYLIHNGSGQIIHFRWLEETDYRLYSHALSLLATRIHKNVFENFENYWDTTLPSSHNEGDNPIYC